MTPTHPPHFQINISTEFVTAFAFSSIADYFFRQNHWLHSLFPLLRIIFRPNHWLHSLFPLLQIIFSAIFMTAFASFFYCGLFFRPNHWLLSLFPLLQIIFSTIFVTAFTFFLYCRLFFPPYLWLLSLFPLLQIIFPPYLWLHSHLFSIADYLLAPLIYACCQLTGREIPCMDRNTREACVMRCRLASATKPTVWAQASLGDWWITDVCIE